MPTTSGRKTEPTMVSRDRSNGAVLSTPLTMNNEAPMRPGPMKAMLCTMVPEASRRATGNELGRFKKLAQFPEFEVKEAGTNTPRMVNATALNVTACVIHLKIRIQLAGVTALAMIDSGTTRNFMSRKFATNHRIPELPKKKPYQLTVVD